MEYISMILLAVVLAAQIVLFALYFLEKRYVNHRFSAMLQYIDRKVEDADCREEIRDALGALDEKTNERFNRQSEDIREFEQNVSEKMDSLSVDYTDMLDAFGEKVNGRFDATNRKIAENYSEILGVYKKAFEQQDKEIDERFKILAIDYSEAQHAADKVNEFATGLASIFDYDPLVAIKKGRRKEAK